MGKSLYPQKLGFTFIVISLIIALSLEIIINYFFTKELASESFIEWGILQVRNFALFFMVLILIVFSLRAMRFYKTNASSISLLTLGILLSSSFAYIGYAEKFAFVSKASALKIDLVGMEDRLDRHLFRHNSLEDKMVTSLKFAEAVYYELGKKIEYLKAENRYEIFEPSKKNIKNYISKEKALEEIKRVNIYSPVYAWSILIFISLILGLATPIKRKDR